MNFEQIVRGKRKVPYRLLIHGREATGKTTFAAQAPKPIIICGEDGASHLDVPKWEPQNWEDVMSCLSLLDSDGHGHETVVIDTLDAIEPWCWAFVSKRDGKADLESYGYGKGVQVAIDEWRVFLAHLERLKKRGMGIILIAHSGQKQFKNPEGPDYDRYELKVHAKAAGLFKEWVEDCLYFAREVFYSKEKGGNRTKGMTGDLVMYTTGSAAYDAKNRHNLPPMMSLNWGKFSDAMDFGLDPSEMVKIIETKLVKLPPDRQDKARTILTTAGLNITALAELNGKLDTALKQMEA